MRPRQAMSGVWLLMGLRRKGRTWMVYVPAPTITPWAPLAMPIDRPAEDAIDARISRLEAQA